MYLHLFNMGQQITESSLWATFAAYGTVDSAAILRDELTGLINGRGYVFMPHQHEALLALNRVNGCVINGKMIVVSEDNITISDASLTL